MKPTTYLRQFLALAGSSLLAVSSASAQATSATWDENSNSNWTTVTNWVGNTAYAEGTDNTATLGNFINGDRTITLNTGITIGNITAQDTTHNYIISGANTLTFDVTSGSPTVSVVAGRSLIFTNTIFAGDDGLTFDGPGNFQIWQATLNHTGGTIVNGGAALLTNNNLGSGNWRLNNGVLSDRYRTTTTFSSGLGDGNNQIQVYGESGFGGGNGNSNWRIGTQNSVLKWGTVGEGATGFFNPTALKFFSAVDNMGTSIYGQITFQNGIDLNSGSRTIDVLQAAGPNALQNSWARIDAGITDTGSGGSLTKTGGGNLIIAGTSNYAGGTTINAGAVRFDRIAAMPSSGNVQVNDGAILGVRVGGTGNWSGGTSGVGTLGGLIAGVGGAGTSTVSYSGNVGLLLDVTTNTSSSATITNAGATSLALYKMGGSALTLSGNNSYSGGTFLQQGTIIADSATALSSGDITFRGGTLQYTANSAATDYASQIKNSTSAITLNTNSQNVSLSGMTAGNTGGLTKSGAGILTFTGTNTYSGTTSLNAGTIRVYDGTLSTSGGAVNMVSNTSVSILGGSGVSSTWNVGNQQFGTGNNNYTNIQVLIDGDGVAGSALLTNVNNLVFGRTAANSDMIVTDGGQVSVNGDIRIGDTYYNTLGNTTLTIGGGTATSTVTGNNTKSFYIGFGEREGASNNTVTVTSGGVLDNFGNMVVGHVNNQQGNNLASTANKLTVTGTGTASGASLSVGYAQNNGPSASDLEKANANVVEVTNGGTLTTSGANYIGRANNNFTESNDNTLTVTGTGSSWAAGNQNVFVGFTTSTSATSNNNIMTVGAGATVTGINGLTVGSGAGTETGNQLVVNGILTATTVTVSAGNSLSGSGTINGAVTVNGNLNPGTSPGELNFSNSLALSNTTTTTMEIDGTSLGLTYDNIDVGDALTYDGILTLAIGATFGSSAVFDLFEFGSQSGSFDSVALTGLYTGTFTNSSGVWSTTTNAGNETWSFSQDTGDLTLTVIPEPSSVALLGTLGAMLLLRRRR